MLMIYTVASAMKKLPFLPMFTAILIGQILLVQIFDLNKLIAAPVIAAVLYGLYAYFDLNPEDVGAKSVTKKSIYWSVVALCSVFIALGIVYLAIPEVFMDKRYDQPIAKTLVALFFLLPLTTVILEEFAFRGVLLGYLLKFSSRKRALTISSFLFGLWHVPSSFLVHVESFLFIHNPPQVLVSIAVIIVTGFAGLIFSLLRLKTKSILVPIVAHWSLNAAGMLFAWLSWNS